MIYTPAMQKMIHSIPVPANFVMDIVEFDAKPVGFLLLRFYQDQWDAFSEEERYRCALYLQTVQRVLNQHGVNASLDPVIGSPR